MFKYLARNHFANKAAISQYAKEASYYSFWMINMRSPENGWRSASGVMVNKNTVLTCAHNFNECDPELSKVVSPRTGQVLEIKTAEIDTENDLAIVTLKGKTREKTANIGRKIEPEALIHQMVT